MHNLLNIHTAQEEQILHLFQHWLDRRMMPEHLISKELAAQQEADALLGKLLEYAPCEDVNGWLKAVLNAVDCSHPSRYWPTIYALDRACKDANKPHTCRKSETAYRPNAIALNAKRIRDREPVCESYLRGINRERLISKGLVTPEDFAAYGC